MRHDQSIFDVIDDDEIFACPEPRKLRTARYWIGRATSGVNWRVVNGFGLILIIAHVAGVF